MLPNENEVVGAVRARYGTTFDAMGRFHGAAITLLSPDALNGPLPGYVDTAVIMASVALYVKACKQYRSVQILCEKGMGSDADSLVRNLFETMVNLVFVLKPRVTLRKDGEPVDVPGRKFPSKLRARLYLVYGARQLRKTVNAWARTSGLKRLASAGPDQADRMWQGMEKEIGPEWSKRQRDGRGVAGLSLVHLAESLGLSKDYAIVYRTGSSSVHATDPLKHIDIQSADGSLTPRFWPPIDFIRQHIMGASMCLLQSMFYFNSRLRLGRNDLMAAAKEDYTLLG